jgi:nitric oxide reductase NorQ protein
MVGPQGCGKTEMARWLAATHGLPWLKVNCPAIQDPRDWFGWMTVRDGETIYQPTALSQAIEHGDCVVFFDELNRLHTSLWGPLYGLLDDTNQVWVDQLGRHLHLRPGTIVIAAMNEGSQNIGVFLQDAALMERFVRIEASFLPPDREAEMLVKRTGVPAGTARALVEVATLARRQAVGDDASLPWQVSTRSLIRTAELVQAGLTAREAFEMTVTLRLPTEGALSSPRAEFLRIIQAKLG